MWGRLAKCVAGWQNLRPIGGALWARPAANCHACFVYGDAAMRGRLSKPEAGPSRWRPPIGPPANTSYSWRYACYVPLVKAPTHCNFRFPQRPCCQTSFSQARPKRAQRRSIAISISIRGSSAPSRSPATLRPSFGSRVARKRPCAPRNAASASYASTSTVP